MNNLKRFKNIHKNKIAITFGTGRSLEQFTMDNFLKYRKRYYGEITRDDIICLGVNKIVYWDGVELDYYFTSDNPLHPSGRRAEYTEDATMWPMTYYSTIQNYIKTKLKKEIFVHGDTRNSFTDDEIKNMPAHKTFLTYSNEIHKDIDKHPFINHSIIYSTIQFAAYTGIEKIYIVGCDCDNSHFNAAGVKYLAEHELTKLGPSSTMEAYWKDIKNTYSEIEIIRINSASLGNLFKKITI